MTKFNLKIVSSDGIFYEGPCESLVIPASDGEYGIQAEHEPMVIAVYIGSLRYKNDDGWKTVVTGQGYARVDSNGTVLVVDTAERPEDVDENRARAAAERAKEKMSLQSSKKSYYESYGKIERKERQQISLKIM